MALLLSCACGAPSMDQRLTQARLSLAQVNTLIVHPSPAQMKAAVGVALLSIVQGGAGIGGEGGGGVVLQRVEGGWGAPYGVDVGAGTIGLQLGGQGKDVMILFNDTQALKDFVTGGMQLQALGEGTFGAASGDTVAPQASMVRFVKCQGLFGGLQLGGLNVSPSHNLNAATYGSEADSDSILSGKVRLPEDTTRLTRMLDAMD